MIGLGGLPHYYAGAVLALLLIGSGRARWARKEALRPGVITAIGFHKPNPRLFLRCIVWLIENGYTFVTANEVIEFLHRGKPVPPGAVWLSFDDGWREVREVLPLIRRLRLPVTLFIPSGVVQGDGRFPWLWDPAHPSFSAHLAAQAAASRPTESRDAFTVEELATIAAYPEVTIGAHSVTHPVMPYCNEENLRFEIAECKRALQSWTGQPVTCYAYPEGKFDGRERRFLIESGYALAVTTRSAFLTRDADCYLAPRFIAGDNVSFPQAICSMLGIWRSAADPLKKLRDRMARTLRRGGPVAGVSAQAPAVQERRLSQ